MVPTLLSPSWETCYLNHLSRGDAIVRDNGSRSAKVRMREIMMLGAMVRGFSARKSSGVWFDGRELKLDGCAGQVVFRGVSEEEVEVVPSFT